MTKSMVALEAVDNARARLKAFAAKPKTEVTKTAAVRLLEREIIKLQRDGHTFSEIAAELRESSIDLSPDSLKTMLQRVKKQGGEQRAKQKKPVESARKDKLKVQPEASKDGPVGDGRFKPNQDREL